MSTYLHLDRSGRAVANTTFRLTTDFTNRRIYSVVGQYCNADPISRINSLYPDGLSEHGIRYLLAEDLVIFDQGKITVRTHISPMIEAIFVLVRMAEFSHRPSRIQSMFAWLSSAEALNFQRQEQLGTIYEVQAEDAFIADQNLLRLGRSGADTYEFARNYWSEERSNNEKLEAVIRLPSAIGNTLSPDLKCNSLDPRR
ncbi:MAG TPA: hypothetical protein VIZ65_06075 [Cellvibrionaceae bacterium]